MSQPVIDFIDDFSEVDTLYVGNRDDNYRYVWLNKKPENLERMKAIYGWEILGGKHNETALVPPNAVGERVNGDVVLARMPLERWEKLQRLKKRRADAQVTAADDAWKAEVERRGLIPDDSTKRRSEVLTRKE